MRVAYKILCQVAMDDASEGLSRPYHIMKASNRIWFRPLGSFAVRGDACVLWSVRWKEEHVVRELEVRPWWQGMPGIQHGLWGGDRTPRAASLAFTSPLPSTAQVQKFMFWSFNEFSSWKVWVLFQQVRSPCIPTWDVSPFLSCGIAVLWGLENNMSVLFKHWWVA